MKTTKLTRLALLPLVLAGWTACQHQEGLPTSEPVRHEAATSQRLQLSLTAQTDPLTIVSMDGERPTGKPRTIGFRFDETHPKYLPHITIQQASFQTSLYLRKKGSADPADFIALTVGDATWKTRTETERGIYLASRAPEDAHSTIDFELPSGKHAPQAGEQWEIAAIMGEGDPNTSGAFDPVKKSIYRIEAPRYAFTRESIETHKIFPTKMDIPYYSDWQDLQIDEHGTLGVSLHFKCVGALFHYRLIYRLQSPFAPPPGAKPGKPTDETVALGGTNPKLQFETNIADLAGACDFTESGGLHWVTKPFPLLHLDNVRMYEGAPTHLLIFGVPKSETVSAPRTVLKSESWSFQIRKEPTDNSQDYWVSTLAAAQRGRVHYGLLYFYFNPRAFGPQ